MTTGASSRIKEIDAARGLAIVLALLAHAIGQFDPFPFSVSPIVRLATPTFLVIFGLSFELAYLRKLREGRPIAPARRRLLRRGIVCYLLFAAIALAAMLGGKTTPPQFLQALVFIDNSRFGMLLLSYASLFILIVALLPLAVRHGAMLFAALAAAAWALRWLCMSHDFPYLSTLIGQSEGLFAPAVFPSLTFFAFGLLLGEIITGRRRAWPVPLFLAGACIVIAHDVLSLGVMAAVQAFIDGRWTNDPLYYAVGLCGAAGILTLFWARRKLSGDTADLGVFTRLGRETLLLYTAGNIILNLLPIYKGTGSFWMALTFMVAMILLGLNANRFWQVWDPVAEAVQRRLGLLPQHQR